MNKTKIIKAAQTAEALAGEIQTNYDSLSELEVTQRGEDIKRSGNTIVVGAGEPEPVEPPWEPEPEPEPEPPPLPNLPVAYEHPDRSPFAQTIEKNGGACVSVSGDDRVYQHMRVRYGQWMGFSIAKQDPTNGVVGFTLEDSQLETGWAGDYKGWGERGYDMAEFAHRRVSYLCSLPLGVNIEHGAYLNIYRGGIFEDCYFQGITGQALQFVWTGRQTESANFDGLSAKNQPGDVVLIDRCQFFDCGSWKSGRASFAISMFSGIVGMTIKDSLIQKTNEPKVHGAVLFQGSGKERLEMLNTRIFYSGAPDRELLQATKGAGALVDGGEYHPGDPVKGLRFMDCGPVEFTGNPKGNCSVWVGQNGTWHTKTTLAAVGGGTIL